MKRTTALLIATAALSGCATLGASQSLEVRAQDRWNALVGGDWAGAYAYLSPGARAAMSEAAFAQIMNDRTITWTDAEVTGVGPCDDSVGSCEVTVNVAYEVRRGVPGLRRPVDLRKGLTESWIEVDGTWYFVPDRLR